MAPRWLERHEQSFITLATIIQVKTVQGLPGKDHLVYYIPYILQQDTLRMKLKSSFR